MPVDPRLASLAVRGHLAEGMQSQARKQKIHALCANWRFLLETAAFYPILISMRFLLALLLPFSVFFTIGRPFAGLLCLILQLTVIGWVPAAIWAVYALSQYKTEQKIQKALNNRYL